MFVAILTAILAGSFTLLKYAIVIFLAQLSQFKVPGTVEVSGHGAGGGEWLSGVPLYTMLGLVVLTMAVVEPMIRAQGIDIIWFGIFIVVVVEMAQITPPIGFNLFVMPMVLMVFVLIAVPELATWLPENLRQGPGGG